MKQRTKRALIAGVSVAAVGAAIAARKRKMAHHMGTNGYGTDGMMSTAEGISGEAKDTLDQAVAGKKDLTGMMKDTFDQAKSSLTGLTGSKSPTDKIEDTLDTGRTLPEMVEDTLEGEQRPPEHRDLP